MTGGRGRRAWPWSITVALFFIGLDWLGCVIMLLGSLVGLVPRWRSAPWPVSLVLAVAGAGGLVLAVKVVKGLCPGGRRWWWAGIGLLLGSAALGVALPAWHGDSIRPKYWVWSVVGVLALLSPSARRYVFAEVPAHAPPDRPFGAWAGSSDDTKSQM